MCGEEKEQNLLSKDDENQPEETTIDTSDQCTALQEVDTHPEAETDKTGDIEPDPQEEVVSPETETSCEELAPTVVTKNKKPYKPPPWLLGCFLIAAIATFILLGPFRSLFISDNTINTIDTPPPAQPPAVTYTGEFIQVIPFAFDEILYLGGEQFLVLAQVTHSPWASYNWGIIDVQGNEIVPFGSFEPIDGSILGSFLTHDGNYFFRQGNDFVALDRDGEILAAISGHQWVTYVTYNRFLVRHEQVALGEANPSVSWGVLDQQGEFVIPLGMYDEVREANRLGFFVRNGDYMSVVDFDGAVLLEMPAHYRLWSINGTRVNLTNTRYPLARRGIIDVSGEIIVPRDMYYIIHDREDGTSFASLNGVWHFLDIDGTRLFSFGSQNRVNDFGNRFLASGSNGTSVWTSDGRRIFAPGRFSGISPAHHNLFIVSDSSGVGIIDDTGSFVLPQGEFDEIYHLFTIPADRNFVRRGRYWGVVDSQGNEIVPVRQLNQIRTMQFFGQFDVPADPAFLVRGTSTTDFTVFDINGEIMIPSGEFEDIFGLHGGMAIVRYDGRVGVVEVERENS